LQFIEEVLEAPAGTLKADELLADIKNWDSLAFLTLLAGAETKFGLTLNPADVRKCESVGRLCALIESQLPPGPEERSGSQPTTAG
jgi:acyl carrier protein